MCGCCCCCSCCAYPVEEHLWRQEIENFHSTRVVRRRRGMCGMSASLMPTKTNPRANNIYANLIICTRTRVVQGQQHLHSQAVGDCGLWINGAITDAPNWLQWHPREFWPGQPLADQLETLSQSLSHYQRVIIAFASLLNASSLLWDQQRLPVTTLAVSEFIILAFILFDFILCWLICFVIVFGAAKAVFATLASKSAA